MSSARLRRAIRADSVTKSETYSAIVFRKTSYAGEENGKRLPSARVTRLRSSERFDSESSGLTVAPRHSRRSVARWRSEARGNGAAGFNDERSNAARYDRTSDSRVSRTPVRRSRNHRTMNAKATKTVTAPTKDPAITIARKERPWGVVSATTSNATMSPARSIAAWEYCSDRLRLSSTLKL